MSSRHSMYKQDYSIPKKSRIDIGLREFDARGSVLEEGIRHVRAAEIAPTACYRSFIRFGDVF